MTAGLPGTGIGGLFYILAALIMPFYEMARTLAGRSSAARWRLVARHGAVAWGILGAVWLTGWILGLPAFQVQSLATQGRRLPAVFTSTPLLLVMGTLAAVLLAVESLRLVFVVGTRTQQEGKAGRRSLR